MRIGLIRHFRVERGMPSGWMTAAQLQRWQEEYDASAAIVGSIDAGGHAWQRCISSDLNRAYVTAKALYSGEIAQTSLLREPTLSQLPIHGVPLPLWAWTWIFRLAWIGGHSSLRDVRNDLMRRVCEVVDLLEKGAEDTLVVSHAGVMAYLRKQLIQRGFSGPKFKMAEHARLYVFEKRRESNGHC